jgi:DNA modification methylase
MKEALSATKKKNLCQVCKEEVKDNLGEHIKKVHGENELKKVILKAKENGMSDQEIGRLYNITFRQLESMITEAYGVNISVLKKPKKINYWAPKNFKEEATSIWSFKQRGNWATHDGRYRGNWSPYIPRNVILKYSKPGDLVVDYFVGSGTTAVEAKLLGRRCIARDINPAAIGLTKQNLKFNLAQALFENYETYEPIISIGDARDLSDISDESIDLICAHPPYAGIINYSSKVEGDLSKLSIDDFLIEMGKVARESYRVLKPGGKCAILIGDTRKKKHVIPIGFHTINPFLKAGFNLKELVIKRQHNCKTTGFWYEKSIRYNFLLLAHEYLPIFEKPKTSIPSSSTKGEALNLCDITDSLESPKVKKIDEFETTTVWIFSEKDFEAQLNKNVINRYSKGGEYLTISFTPYSKHKTYFDEKNGKRKISLLFIKAPFLKDNPSQANIEYYLKETKKIAGEKCSDINKGGYLVLQTRDARIDGFIEPLGKKILDIMNFDGLWLKEIVIVTEEEQKFKTKKVDNGDLQITHQYLLIYEVTK